MAHYKKLISTFLIMLLVAAMGIMTSCDDDVKNWPSNEPAGGVFSDDSNGVTFEYEAYISSAVGGDMRQALDECLVNKTGAVGDATRLVVLSSFSDIDAALLEKAYSNGATIAIVNPRKADIDAFFGAHPEWSGHSEDDDLDGSLLYSFDKDGCSFIILNENDPDCIEPQDPYTVAEENVSGEGEQDLAQIPEGHNNIYGYIGPWLKHLIRDEEQDASWRLNADSETDQVEKFAKCYHYSKTYTFTAQKTVRKLLWSSPDEIDGSGSITVSYDVYQVHVYEGEAGAGDYYLVDMCASVANNDMFKGKWWNKHGGCYVRITGYYCKSFNISSQLVKSDGSAVNVTFPADASPTPGSTTGKTQYTNSTTLNLGGSTSLSAGADVSATGPSINASRSLGLSLGWSWTKSVNRDVSDIDISARTSGAKTGWALIFNNLPYFDWDQQYGFNLGNAQAYRSTQDLHASWAWYEADAKDDDDKAAYSIKFSASADYGSMDFLTTKADLKTHTWTLGKVNDTFKLEKIANGRAGQLVLNNDFTDQYISNIKVYDANKPDDVYYLNKNSFEPGAKIPLGAYLLKVNGNAINYLISYDANKVGLTPKTYVYTLNSYIPIVFKQTTTVNAKNDCTIVP